VERLPRYGGATSRYRGATSWYARKRERYVGATSRYRGASSWYARKRERYVGATSRNRGATSWFATVGGIVGAFDGRSTSRLGCQAKIQAEGAIECEITRESLDAFYNEHPNVKDPRKA
jgi:hypothetical protein